MRTKSPIRSAVCSVAALAAATCAVTTDASANEATNFFSSGSIVLTDKIPLRLAASPDLIAANSFKPVMAPLTAYLPPSAELLSAEAKAPKYSMSGSVTLNYAMPTRSMAGIKAPLLGYLPIVAEQEEAFTESGSVTFSFDLDELKKKIAADRY